MTTQTNRAQYSRERAAQLIAEAYRSCAVTIEAEFFKKSILEDEIGSTVDSWNVGLLRFLDEGIYLAKLLDYHTFASELAGNQVSKSSVLLSHQFLRSLLAVRVLCSSGLDGAARQNLRAVYEIAVALSRSLVDDEFSSKFAEQNGFQAANEFWHQFIARQKSEKFLKAYNDRSSHKCFLVATDHFSELREILGVSAHPNFIGWQFDWQEEKAEPLGQNKMFYLGPELATERVLVAASELALLTLQFIAPLLAEKGHNKCVVFKKNPLFDHHANDSDAVRSVSRIAALMFLILTKWTNRTKPDFDPTLHF